MAQSPGLEPDFPLKDIHLPDVVGYWPLAPGWWLLLGLLILLAAVIYLSWRYWKSHSMRRLAIAHLDELAKLPEQKLAAALSRLLRQAVISHFPSDHAGLSGLKLLEFLDRPFSERPFTTGVGRSLLDAPYRVDAQVDTVALIALCRRWLKKLPPQTQVQRRGR